MAEYLGLCLKVILNEGDVVVGTVSGIDKTTHNLTLASVEIQTVRGELINVPTLDIPGSRIRDIKVIQAQTPLQSKSSETPADIQSETPKPKNVQPQKSKSKTKKDSKHHNKVNRAEPLPASASAQVPFVDPAIISIGSPDSKQKREKKAAPAATPPTTEKASTGLETLSNAPQQVNKTPSTPKLPPKLPVFADSQTQSNRRLLETVVFSDYKEFVKSRGRSGKKVAEPEKGPSANGVEHEHHILKKPNDNQVVPAKFSSSPETETSSPVTSPSTGEKPIAGQTVQHKQGERSSINVPPSLIPPKARSRVNGKAPESKTTADQSQKAAPVEVGEAVQVAQPKVREKEEVKKEDDKSPVIKTVAGGIRCPVVTPDQMRRVEDICATETGPNQKMMVENAGHGASMMALKAIGGHRRIQPDNHNAAPLVVILAGNNSAGSYSLAAARHLANRACQVIVFLACGKSTFIREDVAEQKRCAEYAGARFVASIDELPQQYTMPVDLIIDALMGCQTTLKDLRSNHDTRQLVWDAMDWANNNKAPVLSLDFPSGVNGVDGHPFHVMHYIRPKWTLCFGAPKQGCTSREVTGELFLADMGIPAISWKSVGISRNNIPWGAEFVLALEYGDVV
ncbi:enhancer of mRNA decapping [Apophysomyces ossiformis]|uniref:Enhancer of mRNA decapping n=1 Tax=Apophysomyces ossiformis TaxID=679940 RepID=A0A8H7C084_9FUNG|nr:enhancer of mRNA decapping [Apophysomyces ossiformis]